MKFSSKFFAAVLMSAVVFVSCKPDNPDPAPVPEKPVVKPEEPEPELKSVLIPISAAGAHAAQVLNMGKNTYTITCTGGDPYVFTPKFTADIPVDHAILEFEYTADADLTADLQIFYVTSVPSENSSKIGRASCRERV